MLVILCFLDSTESKVAGVHFQKFFICFIRNPMDQTHLHGRKLSYYRFYSSCFASFKITIAHSDINCFHVSAIGQNYLHHKIISALLHNQLYFSLEIKPSSQERTMLLLQTRLFCLHFISFFFSSGFIFILLCTFFCVRVPLELELQSDVSCIAGAGN